MCACYFSLEDFFRGMAAHLSYFLLICVISPTRLKSGLIDAVGLFSKSPFWLISWPHWHLTQTQETKREENSCFIGKKSAKSRALSTMANALNFLAWKYQAFPIFLLKLCGKTKSPEEARNKVGVIVEGFQVGGSLFWNWTQQVPGGGMAPIQGSSMCGGPEGEKSHPGRDEKEPLKENSEEMAGGRWGDEKSHVTEAEGAN